METQSKWMEILTSRKFWAAVIGLLISMGVLNLEETDAATLAQAFSVVAITVAYILGVAWTGAAKYRSRE